MLRYEFLNMAAAVLSLVASLPTSVTAQQQLQGNVDLGINPTSPVARDLQGNFCAPQPIRTFNDGAIEVFAEEIYLVALLSNPAGQIVDDKALNAAVPLAYERSKDCSRSSGSIRSLTNCTLISQNIVLNGDAILMKCQEYASNSIDGNSVFSSVDLYTDTGMTCRCDCGSGIFSVQTAPDGICTCNCSDNQGSCVCYAPYIEDFIGHMNELYKDNSDQLGINVTVVSIADVEIVTDCDSPFINYNFTAVCLPAEEKSVVPSPTLAPTPIPTHKPTRLPTRKPTRKPTRTPTKSPTKKPTKRPTKKPTQKPTYAPTKTPAICTKICDIYYYENMCYWLKKTNLCDYLNDESRTWTLFTTYDYKWDFPDTWSVAKMKEHLQFHILHPVMKPSTLECDERYRTHLRKDGGTGPMGWKFLNIKCEDRPVRNRELATDRKLLQDTETVKFVQGPGNKNGNLPEIWDVFITTANGNIIEVDSPILL